jgi:ABC-type transport system involved in cytochrome bd biosynthesis fused ATPase/permease subunit
MPLASGERVALRGTMGSGKSATARAHHTAPTGGLTPDEVAHRIVHLLEAQ